MRIRPYIESRDYGSIEKWIDNEKIHALWCAGLIPYPVTRQNLHDLLERNAVEWTDSAYVATEDDGTVTGFFCYSINTDNNEGFLKLVVVDPAKRGRGYGSRMLKLALQYAFYITGAERVQINVFTENHAARRCYEKLGFTERSFTEHALSYQGESWGRYNLVIQKKGLRGASDEAMKYLIIGAGGTGGCIGAYMTEAGKDVTLIARGAHLAAIQADGLRMETTKKGNYTVRPVKAVDMEHYEEHPDVIFVCVKGYSLAETVPFIRRVAKPETVVIPILNIYGTGGRLQEQLPELLVTDGCIYIAGEIREPGCLWQNGDIFRVVFGVRKSSEYREVLADVKKDLDDSGITGILSDNIQRDALQKFSYVSPAAACGQYYDAMAGDMQKPGEIRDTFAVLIHEIDVLAEAMGIRFEVDIVQTNLDILDSLTPEASTSMQRDVKKGKDSEMDGLIFEVVRMGRRYGVKLPVYEKIAEALKENGFS